MGIIYLSAPSSSNQSFHADSVLGHCDWEHPYVIHHWHSSACLKDKGQLERIVRTASKIIGCSDMKPIASLHSLRSDRKVMATVQDTSHPANHLFQPLPSGRRYRALRARTSRFQNSFYNQAIRCFSKWSVCVSYGQSNKVCSVCS